MTLPVRLRREAEQDLENAARWYEAQQPGLGQRFIAEVARTFDLVGEQPAMYPAVGRMAHRALIRRFPFCVFYRIEEASIIVVAVMHGSRHPSHWKSRT